jgi:hypothetical protein
VIRKSRVPAEADVGSEDDQDHREPSAPAAKRPRLSTQGNQTKK